MLTKENRKVCNKTKTPPTPLLGHRGLSWLLPLFIDPGLRGFYWFFSTDFSLCERERSAKGWKQFTKQRGREKSFLSSSPLRGLFPLTLRKIMKNLWDQGSIRLKLTLINRAIWFKLFKRTDRVLPWKMPYHVTVSDEISPICSAPYTKVLKNQWLPEFLSRQIKFNRPRKLDSLLTRTVFRFASESQLPALYWTAFIYLLFHT